MNFNYNHATIINVNPCKISDWRLCNFVYLLIALNRYLIERDQSIRIIVENLRFSLLSPAAVQWPNGVCGARVTWHVAKGCRPSLDCCSCLAKITRNVQIKSYLKRLVRVTELDPRAKSMRLSQKVKYYYHRNQRA